MTRLAHDTLGRRRKKTAGTSTSTKRSVARKSGGSASSATRITTKLVPQTKTIANARRASRQVRCVVIKAPKPGHYKMGREPLRHPKAACRPRDARQASSSSGAGIVRRAGSVFLGLAIKSGRIFEVPRPRSSSSPPSPWHFPCRHSPSPHPLRPMPRSNLQPRSIREAPKARATRSPAVRHRPSRLLAFLGRRYAGRTRNGRNTKRTAWFFPRMVSTSSRRRRCARSIPRPAIPPPWAAAEPPP